MDFFIAGLVMGWVSSLYFSFWLECKLLDEKFRSKLNELARVNDETR